MQLTVAIPTYNRNHILLDNLTRLLPQLTPDCRLLILDNCSAVPVADTLRETLAQFPAAAHQIIRNRANIGGNANIVRCFELCETEWVWVLGDDDDVEPDAIETILRHIVMHPECLLINFAYDHARPESFETRGLKEFVDKLDRSADVPWTSSSVYKATAIIPQAKFGYQHAYSLLPHVAMLLVAVADTGVCCFSREQIVDKVRLGVPVEQQWSLVNLALGFPTLLDLPLEPAVRVGLANKLMMTNHSGGIHLHGLVYQLLIIAIKQRDWRGPVYYFDQICGRWYYFDRRPRLRVRLLLYRFVLRYPGLTRWLFKLLKGREIGATNLQDRYERV